jgi:hypothetical protein
MRHAAAIGKPVHGQASPSNDGAIGARVPFVQAERVHYCAKQ